MSLGVEVEVTIADVKWLLHVSIKAVKFLSLKKEKKKEKKNTAHQLADGRNANWTFLVLGKKMDRLCWAYSYSRRAIISFTLFLHMEKELMISRY